MLQVESYTHKSWMPKFTSNGRPIFNCVLAVQIWRANGRPNSPGPTKSRPQFWPSKFSRSMDGQSSPSLVAHHMLPTMVAQNFWQPIYHALCTSTKPTAIWLSTARRSRYATVSISFCASPPHEERKSMRTSLCDSTILSRASPPARRKGNLCETWERPACALYAPTEMAQKNPSPKGRGSGVRVISLHSACEWTCPPWGHWAS